MVWTSFPENLNDSGLNNLGIHFPHKNPAWMELKVIELSEINQRKDEYWSLTCIWNLKKSNTREQVLNGRNFGYKMTKFWGSNIQHGEYSLQYCLLYLKVA